MVRYTAFKIPAQFTLAVNYSIEFYPFAKSSIHGVGPSSGRLPNKECV